MGPVALWDIENKRSNGKWSSEFLQGEYSCRRVDLVSSGRPTPRLSYGHLPTPERRAGEPAVVRLAAVSPLDVGRVLVLNDPPAWTRRSVTRVASVVRITRLPLLSGMGGIKNEHMPDVASPPPPPPPHVCTRLHPDGKPCSDIGRVLVLNDPTIRPGNNIYHVSRIFINNYGRHALDIKAKPTSFVWDWVGMAPAVWVG